MVPTFETCLFIWRSEEGYKKINNYLTNGTTAYKYKQPLTPTLQYEGATYKISDIIDVIKKNMTTHPTSATYYRGGSPNSKRSFKKETFISVSTDIEQAQTFLDGPCCLYTVTVDPDVKRLHTGIENEVLIENESYWEYLGDNEVVIHSPKNAAYSHFAYYNAPKDVVVVDNSKEYAQLFEEAKQSYDELGIDLNVNNFIDFVKDSTNGRLSITEEDASHYFKGGRKIKRNKKTNKRKHRKNRKTTKRKK
jgi:hypothetical protein